MKTHELHDIIAAVCPVDGISAIGEIWFKAEATPAQRADAQALMDTHLPALDTSFP